MTAERPHLSAETAAALFEEHYGAEPTEIDGWRFVAIQEGDSGRWTQHHTMILRHANGLFGLDYEVGLTENQDSEYPWREGYSPNSGKPMPIYPVYPEEVTVTVYHRRGHP